MQLVLSLMPGIDLFGEAFRREGFSVVQAGDLIFGGDVRREHYPVGRFDGIISGPPCQSHSSAANISRSRGQKQMECMISEFCRVVVECKPAWWVMENVRGAPVPMIEGYDSYPILVNNRWYGGIQRRVRRFTSNLVLHPEPVALMAIRETPTASLCRWRNGRQEGAKTRRDFEEFREWQGFPELELPAFKVAAACKAVVQGVPLPMGLAIARAVKEATCTAEERT